MRFVSRKFYVTYFFKESIVHLCQIEAWALGLPVPRADKLLFWLE